jgi:hypothetical protein
MDGPLSWEPTLVDRVARWTCRSVERHTITYDNGRICQDRLDSRWQPKLESTFILWYDTVLILYEDDKLIIACQTRLQPVPGNRVIR